MSNQSPEATSNVIPFPMKPERRAYWHAEASRYAVMEEDALTALETAQRGREHALRMLGMLGIEKGLTE